MVSGWYLKGLFCQVSTDCFEFLSPIKRFAAASQAEVTLDTKQRCWGHTSVAQGVGWGPLSWFKLCAHNLCGRVLVPARQGQ